MSHLQPTANDEWFSCPAQHGLSGPGSAAFLGSAGIGGAAKSPHGLEWESLASRPPSHGKASWSEDWLCATRSSRRSRADDAQCLSEGATQWATSSRAGLIANPPITSRRAVRLPARRAWKRCDEQNRGAGQASEFAFSRRHCRWASGSLVRWGCMSHSKRVFKNLLDVTPILILLCPAPA
jgi:hypothetical protein